MAREFSPEELGISPVKEFSPQELGVVPSTPQARPEDVGIGAGTGAAFKRGLESFSDIYGGYSLAKSKLLGEDVAAAEKIQQAKVAASQQPEKPALTFADLERIYAEKGLGSALAQAPKYIAEQAAQSAPQMAVPLAVGAGAGALSGPFAPIVAPVAGVLTYGAQQFGNLMTRQAQEKTTPEELDVGKALTASAIQAPIGYFADRFALGIGGMGQKGVIEIGKELAARKALGEIGAAGVAKGVAGQAAKGAAEGFIAEAPTEVLEQTLERWQAGLPLTNKDAINEYKEAFAGAGAIGGVGGAGSRGYKAYSTAQQPAEAPKTEEVKTETKAPATLMLPSPEEIILNQREYDPLKNPLGNFTTNELTPEQIKFIDKDRKDNGKPRLNSYSLEDLVDAVQHSSETQEAKQGIIDNLLTVKSGYTGDELLTPQDLINIAEMKNVETQTAGFTDFLRRATGADDLETMSQPQLYTAFDALSKLPVSEELQILPEGTNAVRFSEKQYADALKGLEGVYDEYGTNALSRTSVIQEIQDFAGLERPADAEAIYKQALRNNDLEEALREVKTTEGMKTVPEVSLSGKPTALPSGFDIQEQEFKQGVMPESYEIRNGNVLIDTAKTEAEANQILEKQTKINEDLVKQPTKDIEKLEKAIENRNRAVDIQKAKGFADTLGFQKMAAHVDALNRIDQKSIAVHQNDIKNFTNPLQILPVGEKPVTAKKQVFYEDGKPVASFGDKYQAEQFGIMKLDDAILQQIIDSAPTTKGILPKRYAAFAAKEIERRAGKAPKGIEVTRSIYTDKVNEDFKKLEQKLLPALKRFGLENVGLRVVNSISNGQADGSYIQELIKIAYSAENPMATLRHESIHALKELGAFSDAEWKVLSNKAKSDWIDQYIKQPNLYKAYQDAYKSENGSLKGFDEYIQEEAIAEAFSDFANTKPPAGLIGNIFYRLNKLFEALGNTFKRLGYTTAGDIFNKVEKGQVAPTKGIKNAKEKQSLRKYTPEGLPESEVRPSDTSAEGIAGLGDRGRGEKVRSFEALEGAPIIEGATGPDSGLVSVAERYAEANGIPYERQKTYVKLDEDRAKRIAQAYEDMANEPNDPKVKAAYKDMIRQLKNQYKALVDDGYEFTFFDSETDPYDGNPWNAMRDLRNNKKMAVYGTYDGFGTKGITDKESKGNILLQDTGFKWKDQNGVEHSVTANDLFRAVHDAFGHGLEGAGFRAQGEENAWQAHAKLFTGDALGALTSETRGQNSWLNYSTYGEQNRNATVEDTIFAPQKIGLMPEWTWEEGAEAPKGIVLGKKQPDAQTYEGIHYSTAERKYLDGSSFGKGLKGAESKRLVDAEDSRIKNRAYFYIPHELTGKNIPPEAGVGMHAHKQTFGNILPPGKEMKRLNAEAGNNANKFESLVIDAGYDGYAVPSMGMMVILNHDNIPVKYRGTQAEMKVRGEKFQIKTPKEIQDGAKAIREMDEDTRDNMIYYDRPGGYAASNLYDAQNLLPKPSNKLKKVTEANAFDLSNEVEYVANVDGEYFGVVKDEDPDNEDETVYRYFRLDQPRIDYEPMTNDIEELFADMRKHLQPAEVAEKFQLKPLNIDKSVMDRINATTHKRVEKGFVERIVDAISPTAMAQIRQAMINKYEGIERLTRQVGQEFGADELLAENSAIAAALQSDRAAGVAASSFRDGVPVYDKGYTYVSDLDGKVKGLIPVLQPLMSYNNPEIFQAFQYYAATRRGKRLLADGREQLFTAEDIKNGEDLEKQFPEFKEVFNEYQKYNQGLVNYMKDTGVISEKEAKLWTENWDYIPFYRQLDGERTAGPKVFSAIAGVAKPKKLKGGTAEIDDFMETVVRNARAAIEAGMKNEAARRVVRDAVRMELAEEVPVGSAGSDIVTVKEEGLTKYYRVADPLLVESMKGLNLPQMDFLSWLAAPANLLRNFVTKDPGFMIANLGRDSLQAWITSGTDMKPIVDTFKQFGSTLTNKSPEASALAKAGLTGYDFAGDVASSAKVVEKELRKRGGVRTPMEKSLLPLTAFWDALEHGSHASDMATRAEVYKKTLARTGSEAEAFYQAMEVLNFSRKGNSAVIRVVSAMVPFFNARLQGLDVLYRSGWGKMATENADVMKKAFAARSMMLMGMSMLYWFLVSDDEEYKRLGKEERDNYWIVPALSINGKPFRFPIPFELGVVFKVLPERVLETAFGNDTGKDLKEALARNAFSTLQFNPIPQAFVPVVENVANYSFFTGEPIVGRGMEDVAPQFQATQGTSQLAKDLGAATGTSPMKIENLIRGYTGTMGTYAMQLLDAIYRSQGDSVKASTKLEQMPVIKRFFASDSGTVAAYYDMKGEIDQITRTLNVLERTGNNADLKEYLQEHGKLYGLKNYVSVIDKDMKKLRQFQMAITSSTTMDADAKRQALDAIHQRQLALTDRIKILRKQFE